MVLFGIPASATTGSLSFLRAFVGLLALSKTSLSFSKSNNNGQRDPSNPPNGWETLLNSKICSALEKQDLFHAHYAQLGNPSWKLDLQPTGKCVLEFTEATTGGDNTVAKYDCRLVGSESNTAGTFLWAIPPDPTMGVPHDLMSSKDPLLTQDIQTALFQTRHEIAMTPTVNGYSIALMAGLLLADNPAKAVFLGPYGEETGTLYLLITDTETYPNVVDDRPKLERLKGFVSMAAEIPFITNHRTAFTSYANDLGLEWTENADQLVVTVTDGKDKLEAYFDGDDNMKRLGDLALMTTQELEMAKAAQAANQQRQQQQPPPPGGDPNNKCAQLQMNFFQKVMDETVPNQRQLFLEVSQALDLTVSKNAESAKEIEAWDPYTGEAVVGVFDDANLMTQWRNVKKTA